MPTRKTLVVRSGVLPALAWYAKEYEGEGSVNSFLSKLVESFADEVVLKKLDGHLVVKDSARLRELKEGLTRDA